VTVVDSMKLAVRWLQRGRYTIKECERTLNYLIDEETAGIEDVDKRIETEKMLKRKAWRLLLEATKGPARSL